MLGEPFAAGRSRRPSLPSHAGPVADRGVRIVADLRHPHPDPAGGLPYLVDGASWLIGVGLAGALVAAVPGVPDFRMIPPGAPALATARTHLTLNAAAAVLSAAGYAGRAGDHVALDKTRWGQLALSAVAVVFLIAATWLGGTLTYCHGTRVTRQADHDDRTTRRG
jgi:uncharacterized membrane protein